MPQATDQALLNRLIIEWYSVALGQSPPDGLDPFFRFVASWIAFNALYSQDGLGGSERDQIRRFCGDRDLAAHHRLLIERDAEYKRSVTFVMERRILETTNRRGARDQSERAAPLDAPLPPRRRQQDIDYLIREPKKVFLAIYDIRNNLFHGGKRPCSSRDRRLVESSCKIITTLLSDKIEEMRAFG